MPPRKTTTPAMEPRVDEAIDRKFQELESRMERIERQNRESFARLEAMMAELRKKESGPSGPGNPRVMEQEVSEVSATKEINNNDFIVGNSDLESVCGASTISIRPEIEGYSGKINEINCSLASPFMGSEEKDEEKSQKIGFNLKSETDDHLSKNLLVASIGSVCISHIFIFHAQDLFRHSRLEFGELLSSTVVSSPATIVECVSLVSAKASELRSFIFDPGGASEGTGVVRCSDFSLDSPFTSIRVSVSSRLSTDLIEKCDDLTFAKPILVFDPGGSLAVDISAIVVFAFCCLLVVFVLSFSFGIQKSFQALPVYVGTGLQSSVLCGPPFWVINFFGSHYSRTRMS